MGNVIANGIRIWYEEQGQGPAIILAHGLGGTLHEWDATTAFFKDRYRVIAYDARGHGRSDIPDSPEAYSQDIMVQDMLGLMEALNIPKAVVGGHSMGANVALNFALQHPGRCTGVITVGIGSGSTNREWYQEWHDRLADLAEEQGMAAFLAEMENLPAWQSALFNPEIGERIKQEVLDNSPRAIAHTIRGVQKKRPTIFELGPRLENLHVPALIVFSEFDTLVVECSRFMAECIPVATLEMVPSRSHWVHLEKSQMFLEVVERFLSSLS